MAIIEINGIKISYCNKEAHFSEVEAGIWEPETFQVMDEHLKPGKIFLDIGAWVGTLSIYAAKKGCEVIAVEPDIQARKMWLDNLEANNLKTAIQLIPSAIADKPTELGAIFTHDEFGDSMSSLVNKSGKGQPCRVTTLEILLRFIKSGEIGLIKIDIEGSEYLVMNSETLGALIDHNLPPVLLSLHPAWIPNYEEWYDNFVYEYSQYYTITKVSNDQVLLK